MRRAANVALRLAAVALLGSCGGADAPEPPATDLSPDPAATILSPAAGATFRAGDTLTFSGSAVDARDGPLADSALTWWAELHHDTHTHPFRQPAMGGSGSVTIPTRGETSANVFYRFHLRATNSAGRSVEVTRDIQPLVARVTLATSPAGLALTIDGKAVTGPHGFTGVVGIERDIAAADQVAHGRGWRFEGWSHGGAGRQTLSTPATDTTYTANFTELAPVPNQPPAIALSAPAIITVGATITLGAAASDSDGTIARVDFFEGGTLIGSDTTAPYSIAWTPISAGIATLSARAFDNLGASADSALASVTVIPANGTDITAPTATLTVLANLADALEGTLTISADAGDDVAVVGVEFQVDGERVGAEATSAPYSVDIDTTAWASGQHVLRARARDASGNRSPWSEARVRFGGERAVPAGFGKSENWVGGLAAATAFAQAPDGRLFVAEQGGTLRVVKGGVLLPAAFHTLVVDDTGERGLIGVALHPDFASNGFVYVYHTRIDGEARNNRVTRLTADPPAGDVSNGAETPIADLPNLDAPNHNGGAMRFGSDGKLYVAVGDNADSTAPQDLANVLGKMLRLNDDGSIPGDNPFVGSQTGLARAVWAYGLRNPFTFAVQPGSGRMHINDVGEESWEEINLGAAGANYGWPGSEGPENLGVGITAPLFAYGHDAAVPEGSGPGGFFVGFAIAGGAFYPVNGPFPERFRGKYFFADYVSRFIGVLDVDNGNAAYSFGRVDGTPVDMLVGLDGALYVLVREAITRISAP